MDLDGSTIGRKTVQEQASCSSDADHCDWDESNAKMKKIKVEIDETEVKSEFVSISDIKSAMEIKTEIDDDVPAVRSQMCGARDNFDPLGTVPEGLPTSSALIKIDLSDTVVKSEFSTYSDSESDVEISTNGHNVLFSTMDMYECSSSSSDEEDLMLLLALLEDEQYRCRKIDGDTSRTYVNVSLGFVPSSLVCE